MEQYYLFVLPGDQLIWAEAFLLDGTHMVAPTPFTDVAGAVDYLTRQYPGAVVDELADPRELREVRRWALDCPLEQIPVTA